MEGSEERGVFFVDLCDFESHVFAAAGASVPTVCRTSAGRSILRARVAPDEGKHSKKGGEIKRENSKR